MQATLASVAALWVCLHLLGPEAHRQATRECRNCNVLEMALVAGKHESRMMCLILQSITSSVNIKRCASVGDQFGVSDWLNVLHHGDCG